MIKNAESYDKIKNILNELHDKLCSTDDTLKKRFINNPNKEELPYNDLSAIMTEMSTLESQLCVAKCALLQELVRQGLNSVK